MRFAVFGSGGVGGYFGGRLAQSGAKVCFLARGDHLRALQKSGLRVESVHGDFHLHPVEATDDPGTLEAVDVALLAVKTWQVQEAAEAIRPQLAVGGAVVTLQNGVEAPYLVAQALGQERVLPGLVRIFSQVAGPGHIRHLGGPASFTFGEWNDEPSERVQAIADAFRQAGINVEVAKDIQAALWEKFLFVVPLGGVGAVSRAPLGVLRAMPETRRLLEQAMEEIFAVARALGVRLPDEGVQRAMAAVDAQPAAATSSLQRDIAAGRPSELEAWTGAVVRLGERAGVPTPLHRVIYHSLLPLERRARGEVQFSD